MDTLVRSIERVVDKPVPMRLLGFCSTELDGNPCGEPLHARDDQIEVYCRKCRTTRPCDRVRMIAMADARRTRVTWEQVLLINRQQPEGYRVVTGRYANGAPAEHSRSGDTRGRAEHGESTAAPRMMCRCTSGRTWSGCGRQATEGGDGGGG